jgi:hypothetical protein
MAISPRIGSLCFTLNWLALSGEFGWTSQSGRTLLHKSRAQAGVGNRSCLRLYYALSKIVGASD